MHHFRRDLTGTLTTLVACCVVLIGAAGADATPSTHSASPAAPPLYVEDPAGPIELGGPPNSLLSSASEGFTSGEGWGSVLVGFDARKSSEILWNTRRGLFRLSGYHAPPGPGLVTGNTERFAVIDAPHRLARFYSGSDSLYKPDMTLKTGAEPVAAVQYFGDAAILNHGSHDLWVYLAKREAGAEGQLQPVVKVPVGAGPTDVAGGFNLEFGPVFVADAASDTVTELGTLKEGSYQLEHTIPVGEDPVDLAWGQFVPGGEREVAVANRHSNTVSILAGGPENATGPADYARVGTYPAGDEPVAIRAVDVDNNGSIDLAVVDAGSDSLTILLNDGHGHFHRAGSFKTGPDPVAVSPIDTWDATFGPDLAVANRGSNTLTIFLRHYSASCRGREARPITGTDGDDTLYSGQGVAVMRGRAGDDHMFSRHIGNCFYGGAGDDLIVGKSGGDLIDGGPGDDHLYGGTQLWSRHPTADTIIGGPGRDVIEASWGDDTVRAVDSEKDFVNCGGGIDTAYVDPIDIVHHCEHVHVVGSAGGRTPTVG